jgi:hypothetical protein
MNQTDDLVGLNRAKHQHGSCQTNPGLQGIMLMEAYRRFQCGVFSPEGAFRKPTAWEKEYGKLMWAEAHYCLDAPDLLPCGSMESLQIDEEDDGTPIFTSSPTTIHRENLWEPWK